MNRPDVDEALTSRMNPVDHDSAEWLESCSRAATVLRNRIASNLKSAPLARAVALAMVDSAMKFLKENA